MSQYQFNILIISLFFSLGLLQCLTTRKRSLQWIPSNESPSNSKMNKSTSQPHLSRQDLDELENSEWLCRPPESQQIRQFKVIVRDLPRVQRHNWQKHKWPNKGVQSLSNLECIVENSLESDQETENSPADSQDNLDSVRSEQPNRTDQFYKPIGKPIESADRALDSRGSEVLDSRTSNSRASDRADSRMLDSRASDRLADDPRILRTNEPTEVVHSIATISRLSSQLYQTDRQTSDRNVLNSNETNRRLNYQSNLNTFNSQGRSKRSNYKQVKTTDDNFFFGSANQEYERSVSSTASIAAHSDLANSLFSRSLCDQIFQMIEDIVLVCNLQGRICPTYRICLQADHQTDCQKFQPPQFARCSSTTMETSTVQLQSAAW